MKSFLAAIRVLPGLIRHTHGSDPFLRASVMGWTEPQSYDIIDSMSRDHHGVSDDARGDPAKYCRSLARVASTLSTDETLVPMDGWIGAMGQDFLLSAISRQDPDHVVCFIGLVGDLLRKSQERGLVFPMPEGVEDLCADLPDAFEQSVLPVYTNRIRRRHMERRAMAYSEDIVEVFLDTLLSNTHLVCPSLPLHIKQAIISDRIMRFLSSYRDYWLTVSDFTFPEVPSVESVEESLHRLFFISPSHLMLGFDIEYNDSYANGPGVARDWFARLFEKVFTSPVYFSFDKRNSVYRVSVDLVNSPRQHLAQFRAIGTTLGLSILETVPTGAMLNYGLLKYISSDSDEVVFTMEDLAQDDELTFKSLDFLRVCCLDPNSSTMLSCEDALDNLYFETFDGVPLLPGSPRVTQDNLQKYLDLLVQYLMFTRYRSIYTSIKSGFREIIHTEITNGVVTVNELGQILRGDLANTVTVQELKKYSNTESRGGSIWETPLLTRFWDFLEQDPTRPMKLIRFVTGHKALPVGGLKMLDPPISIYVHTFHPDHPLPEAKLCFNKLILPLYPRKDQLDQYLAEALENIDIANAL